MPQVRVVPSPRPDQPRWVNVYRYFSSENIWPRGFPLDLVSVPVPEPELSEEGIHSPIQQGLVDNSPDVDAIWRLTQDRPFPIRLGSKRLPAAGQLVPVQHPEHLVVARGLSLALYSQSLFFPHVRYLEKPGGAAVPLGNGLRGRVPCG